MSANATVLELAGVTKAFGNVPVLRGVDLRVEAGSVHALLGENGAGKSTLMRIVLGAVHADDGAMRLDGADYAPRGARGARARGVVMVPQERTLCPHLEVAENIVLGDEPRGPLGFVRRREARAVATRALTLVTGAPDRIDPSARTGDLKVSDQQLVEIARALAQGGAGLLDEDAAEGRGAGLSAKVLVLDEPTSSLGHDDAVRLFERVRALVDRGLAVILVTHFLSDVREHADRLSVLRDGKVVLAGSPREIAAEEIVHAMLGRELEASATARARAAGDDAGGRALLEVRGLAGLDKPRAASFEVRAGEVFGIAGLVGSGRTELLRVIAGLDRAKAGEIALNAPRGVGLLSEDRGGEGLMLARSIADNVTLSRRGPRLVRPRAIEAEGARWIEQLAIRARGPEQPATELSGGNQQKVQLARLLREDYDVLLVDEPTRGIDVASKAQVLGLLRELAGRGKAVVLVSSQLDELVSTCDRVAVLRRGELGEARPASEWNEASLLLEAAS